MALTSAGSIAATRKRETKISKLYKNLQFDAFENIKKTLRITCFLNSSVILYTYESGRATIKDPVLKSL